MSSTRPAEPLATGVEPDRLRAAMGMFATGVTVVTTRDAGGRPFGTTANAVSSVSLRPPLVLACLREESETLAALLQSRRFAINVLHSDQAEISDRFAKRSAPDTWDAVAHRDHEATPLLEGALVTLRCDLHDVADGGDHTVVVGHVIGLEQRPDGAEPLLFFSGGYRSLGDPPPPTEHPEPTEIALPSRHGALRAISLAQNDGQASLAVICGEPRGRSGVLVYPHPPCVLGDALGSTACPGHGALDRALEWMRDDECGVAVYHRADGALAACCTDPDGEPPALSPEAVDALLRAVRTLELGAIRLVATEADGAAAARAGVPIGELIEPHRLR